MLNKNAHLLFLLQVSTLKEQLQQEMKRRQPSLPSSFLPTGNWGGAQNQKHQHVPDECRETPLIENHWKQYPLRSIPKSIHTVTVLVNVLFSSWHWSEHYCHCDGVLLIYRMMRNSLGERGDVILLLCRKRQQPADHWQLFALNPCSTSQMSCSYSRRNLNHCRTAVQTESGCSAGTVIYSSVEFLQFDLEDPRRSNEQ